MAYAGSPYDGGTFEVREVSNEPMTRSFAVLEKVK
jgi:hypothetical protein